MKDQFLLNWPLGIYCRLETGHIWPGSCSASYNLAGCLYLCVPTSVPFFCHHDKKYELFIAKLLLMSHIHKNVLYFFVIFFLLLIAVLQSIHITQNCIQNSTSRFLAWPELHISNVLLQYVHCELNCVDCSTHVKGM